MLINKISIDSDLSEAAVEEGIRICQGSGDRTLVVSCAELVTGRDLAHKFKMKLMLETDLPKDSWYMHNDWTGIFSPGA